MVMEDDALAQNCFYLCGGLSTFEGSHGNREAPRLPLPTWKRLTKIIENIFYKFICLANNSTQYACSIDNIKKSRSEKILIQRGHRKYTV